MAPGAVEGTHLSRAWGLAPPGHDQLSPVELRLVEQIGEDETGQLQVLLSVTERRLTDDLDPLDELRPRPAPTPAGGLTDITSTTELTPHQTAHLTDQLAAFTRRAQELSAGEPWATSQ